MTVFWVRSKSPADLDEITIHSYMDQSTQTL